MKELGRPVMGGDMTWDFVNEEEFQRRQKETLSYLKKRGEVQSRDAHLKELLKLQAELTEITEGGGHGLRLDLQMNGTAPLELTVAGKVALTIVTPGKKGERVSTHIRTFRREPDRRSLKLPPGERGAVLRYPGTDGPKISSDSTVQARCWVNSIGSTKVRDSVVLTAEGGRGLRGKR